MCDLILYPPNVFQFDLVHKENNSSEVKLKKENVLKKKCGVVLLFPKSCLFFAPFSIMLRQHQAHCSQFTL